MNAYFTTDGGVVTVRMRAGRRQRPREAHASGVLF
jgi:hypothetical protein